jgi:hypothetical protein
MRSPAERVKELEAEAAQLREQSRHGRRPGAAYLMRPDHLGQPALGPELYHRHADGPGRRWRRWCPTPPGPRREARADEDTGPKEDAATRSNKSEATTWPDEATSEAWANEATPEAWANEATSEATTGEAATAAPLG